MNVCIINSDLKWWAVFICLVCFLLFFFFFLHIKKYLKIIFSSFVLQFDTLCERSKPDIVDALQSLMPILPPAGVTTHYTRGFKSIISYGFQHGYFLMANMDECKVSSTIWQPLGTTCSTYTEVIIHHHVCHVVWASHSTQVLVHILKWVIQKWFTTEGQRKSNVVNVTLCLKTNKQTKTFLK